MSSTNTSHFLFFTFPAWGKNYHLLLCRLTYQILGHIRPFCVLAARLVREHENAMVTLMVSPDVLEKTRGEVSRQFLDESSESDSARALQRIRSMMKSCWVWYVFYLSALNLKDPFADPVLQSRPVWKDENIFRCIPCSIPNSIRGQANYMFCNGYNIWCHSRTLCSCLRRKSIYWYVKVDSISWLFFCDFTSTSSLPFMNCMLLEQSAGALCQ